MAKHHVYGIDLGSYEIKVYDLEKDRIWTEKNVVAVDSSSTLVAVGDHAFAMYEKTPPNIDVIFPMREGVISDFQHIQDLLQYLLDAGSTFATGGEYTIAVPADVTELEKRAFFDLLVHSTAKARAVKVIERGVADAIGLGLDVQRSDGIFVANFGGETLELSVIAAGGLVFNQRMTIGGRMMDRLIVERVRHHYNFLIGLTTAEKLRMKVGINDDRSGKTIRIAGRDLLNGVPTVKEIPASLVRASLKPLLEQCVEAILSLIERTPPEVHRIIMSDGIYVAGGLAKMAGLPQYLHRATGLHVHTSRKPELCSVRGLEQIVKLEELNELTYSMQEDTERWV